MSTPQAVSGEGGALLIGGSQVAEIKKWSLTKKRGVKKYGAQSGVVAGVNWMKTVSGTHDWSGSFEGVFDPNFLVSGQVGDGLITIRLDRVKASSYYTGQCRIDTEEHSCDIESGDPEPFTYNFEGHGVLTEVSV